MDVAELRSIYTAVSTDFDRVTDHVQRRLKETQTLASSGLGGASQAVTNEAKKIETTLTSRAPVRFLGIDVAGEKRAAAEVVKTAQQTVNEVKQAQSRFDPAAFWARQTPAIRNVEAETKKATAGISSAWITEAEREAAIHARRAANASRATKTVVTDVATGAKLTQAELAKLVGAGSKVVEGEAKKVGAATGSLLNDLRRLFLQNNFLFRQLGQRAAGDLGFAAVGVSKLAINFKDLTAAEGGAAAELGGLVAGASEALGAFLPLGIAVGAATVGVVALAAATVGAGAGLFLIAKSVSDTEEHFADLNRQTGLSTDNLQTLDVASRQSGTTLDRLNNSVGQLQRKLIDASEGGTSRLSVGLRKLGIDAEDPNRALSQLVDLLGKLPAGTVRTGAAMQIFGRGGRDVAGVIGEIVEQVGNADGALDRFKKQLTDAGVHIDHDGVETAANFHKQLVLVEAQVESIKRVIGEEALPVVLDALNRLSNWIARNRTEISEWAKGVEHAAETIIHLAEEVGKLAALATAPIRIEIDLVRKFVGAVSGALETATPEERARAVIGAGVGEGIGTGIGVGIGGRGGRQPIAPQFGGIGAGRQLPSAQADDIAKRIRDAFAQRGGGGGGRRGEDPAETARRLAEISLRELLKGLDAEHQALERSLDQNLVARDKYTQDAINLELKRRQATIDGLKVELAAAEQIRKPGQRAVKVAEINARILDAERDLADKTRKLTDDSAAEQLRIGQATANSQLRIIETQTDKVRARIREQADFRVITEQQAARLEVNQIERVFNVRRRILEQQQRDAGNNAEKQAEAQNALDELEAERAAALEAFWRQAEERGRQAAEHVVQFAAQIRDGLQRAADVRLEAGEANLEPLRNSILTRHQLWDAELQFEITREQQRHDSVAKDLQDEAELARIRIKNETELAQILAAIHAQEAAEEELHQARLRQLATQRAEQRRQELLRVADDLSDIASQIFDAIGKSSTEFWKALSQTATNFAKQIGNELFKGFLERAITGQAQGAEGLIGAIINPLLGARGPHAAVADNTKATEANTAALNALTSTMGGTPAVTGGLSGALQFLPNLFGGGRAAGGPVEAGRVYRVHENEVFFRPNISGQIANLTHLGNQRDEVRLNVAVGQDAVDDLIASHSLTPKGKRAMLLRAKYNRKVGKLLFA